MIRLLATFVFLVLLQAATPLSAQMMLPGAGSAETVEAPAEPSPNDIKELARLLADPTVVNWLQQRAAGLGEDGAPANLTFRESVELGLVQIQVRVQEVGAALALVPSLPAIVSSTWQQGLTPREQLNFVVLLIIFVFVGVGLEWLYWRYAGYFRRRIELTRSNRYIDKVRSALTRLALVAGGAVFFSLGTIGTFVIFDWPPNAEEFVLELLFALVMLRVVSALALFALAPRIEALRLVPLSRQDARGLYLGVMLASAVMLFGHGLAETIVVLGAEEAVGLTIDIIAAAITTLLAILLLWLMHTRSEPKRQSIVMPVIGSLVLFMLFILWLIGAYSAAGTLAVVALLIPTERLVRKTIEQAFDESRAETKPDENTAGHEAPEAETETVTETAVEQEAGPEADPPGEVEQEAIANAEAMHGVYLPVAVRLGRFVVVVSAVVCIGLFWGVQPWNMSAANSGPAQIVRVLIDVMVAFLIGDLVWTATKTAIDRRMASMPKLVPGMAPGPEARMATLLPLIKKVVLVTILVMVALIGLSSMGINITPLLAGAGVVGLAVGFGAQALVRDIVSGVFFLIDDAFRVGEYIEMGDIRGTVESMSIRSLQLRHHRGAVHTIPFGELKSLTNYSRDWVMMKLEFRVPFDTDLKLAKKIVKNIDAELQENPDYGGNFLQPLKFQGVRRMEEFNMVVGVKFMTKPGGQWTIRRDAYQRIRDEFEKAGINFAQRNVKVEVIGADELDEETKEKATAAAMDAIEQNVQPAPGQ
ncbi:mechanosensitive ion channel family protein [Roseibium sp. MMSF_3412]|uniref:mechanosensitive ion channel family protein n=1 Tax=Roseibium sp. MMSF_3412 TaxID=3046712 RepID=UPI00273F0C2A|nr:mechanosensitive ion channel family protein [Roseibium sp. MMSF_3412]